ncbi:MAG: hypothetical protein WC209_14990 [Ignavibacteriaceae bacterium]
MNIEQGMKNNEEKKLHHSLFLVQYSISKILFDQLLQSYKSNNGNNFLN